MEGFFIKFIVIAGMVFIAITRGLSKGKKAHEVLHQPQKPRVPAEDEVAPDATPVPPSWGRPGMLDDLLQPIPFESTTTSSTRANTSGKQTDRKSRTNSPSTSSPTLSPIKDEYYMPTSETSVEQDNQYSFHSIEEARRAMIWSEILQRKY
jgi:hypothetical protein